MYHKHIHPGYPFLSTSQSYRLPSSQLSPFTFVSFLRGVQGLMWVDIVIHVHPAMSQPEDVSEDPPPHTHTHKPPALATLLAPFL